jgi:transcriptional regulator with XRE-family HTH domain
MKNDLLRRAREERGWTRESLAKKIGSSGRAVGSWERGERFPLPIFRERLCESLEKSPEQLGLVEAEEVGEEVQDLKRLPLRLMDENQQKMLQRVRSRWIIGLLDRMDSSSLITLRLNMQTEVASVWREQVGDMGLPPSLELPFGTTLAQVYDKTSGELLILGEPGAGKTTQLLLLARELIERALLDPDHPIPVIFNLASWASKKRPLVDWLIDELNEKYQVPLRLARSWVEQDRILPLLDGLDEMLAVHRSACIVAINSYRQKHGLLPMVVCCRTSDYNGMSVKLVLGHAVLLESLSRQQINTYLEHQGETATSLRVALQRDQGLVEMVATPLMLSIIVQAYTDLSLDDVLHASTLEDRRHIVFDQYVERVLAKNTKKYSSQQIIAGLSWLAHQMREKNQAEFYVEQLQPDWLEEKYRIRYRTTVSRCVFGLQAIMIYLFIGCLRGPHVRTLGFPFVGSHDILGWMTMALGGIFQGTASLEVMWVVISVPGAFLVYRQKLPPQRLFRGVWQALRYGLAAFVLIVSISALLFHFAAPAGGNDGILQGVSLALQTSFLVFFLVHFFGFVYEEGYRKEKGSKRAPRPFFQSRVASSFLMGVLAASTFVIMYTAQGESLEQAVEYGIMMLLSEGLMVFWIMQFSDGFTFFHAHALEGRITPVEVVSWSWSTLRAGLRENSRNALAVGIFYALWGILFLGCMSALFHGWSYGLRYGFVYGMIIGMISGLALFITAMIKDLWSSDVMPAYEHTSPNIGMRLSARNGLRAAFIFGPCAGIGSGFACVLAFGLVGQLATWFVLSAAFTIVFTLYFAYAFFFGFGGNVVLEHYILRWYLWRSGVVPLTLVQFLDDATHHILLRKIGGGYIFIHRLLLEYFADLS